MFKLRVSYLLFWESLISRALAIVDSHPWFASFVLNKSFEDGGGTTIELTEHHRGRTVIRWYY